MSKRRFQHRKQEKEKKIARERIKELFKQAKDKFKTNPKLSDRYVDLARKIAMKTKCRIPSVYKRQFCKHCYTFLMPGENCRVRTREGTIIYYCRNCKRFNKYVYKGKRQEKKKTDKKVRRK